MNSVVWPLKNLRWGLFVIFPQYYFLYLFHFFVVLVFFFKLCFLHDSLLRLQVPEQQGRDTPHHRQVDCLHD